MKQILIKLAALGLLFSVVSTYACPSCGCIHKASDRDRAVADDQKIRIGRTEGEKNTSQWIEAKKPNSEVNEDARELPVTVTPSG